MYDLVGLNVMLMTTKNVGKCSPILSYRYVEKRIENILDEDAATADAHVQVDQIRTREYFKMHI